MYFLHYIYVDVCMLPSQNGTTPLYIASQNGHSPIAEILLGKGAIVNLPKKVQYDICVKVQQINGIGTPLVLSGLLM